MPNSSNGNNEVSANHTVNRENENNPPPTTSASLCSYSFSSKHKQPIQVQQAYDNGRSRRSNVVKEVERLKKNREERRQRQAELKEEKEALMNMDPGNPNWEFLAMIRCVVLL